MPPASCLIGFLAALAICNEGSEDPFKYERLKHEPPWRVSVVVELPYLYAPRPNPTKNEDYEGYIPDVMMKIGEQLHQSYIITPIPDGDYGNKIEGTDTWTGMIGALIDGTVDLAATPLTVRDDRKEVLDFTEPLFSVRCVAIMKKSPKSSMSLEELVETTDMIILVQDDRRIIQYIKNSSLPHFKKIAAALAADPGLLGGTAEVGVTRVRKGNGKYAFITYSCNGLYFANRDCDLDSVETNLPQTELALAVPKGSPIKERFNAAVTHLREMQALVKIRQKWWEDKCEHGAANALIGLRHPSTVLTVATLLRLL